MACVVASQAASLSLSLQTPKSAGSFSRQATLAGSRLSSPAVRTVSRRSVVVRASEDVSGTQKQLLEVVETAKEKWDKVENKPTVLLYAGGAVLTLWITSSVLGSLDRIPLVPDFLKLVGTVYSGWFVYRYLLFESSRKELKELIEDLKAKITEGKSA